VDQNFRAAQICKKYKIKIWANYILGIRTDTGWHKEDDLLTVAGVLKVDPVHYSPALYTPVSGSKLFDFYKHNNLIESSYSSVEDLSDRGKMASKVKGIDYCFLDSVMITDAIFSAKTDVSEAMKSYFPEMNDMEDMEYITRKSVDAAASIIRVLKGNVNDLTANYNDVAAQASHMVNIAKSREAASENILKKSIGKVIHVNRLEKSTGNETINSKISVVIPVKNGGEQLRALLTKIRKQKKVADIEIVIVDSGSSDDSVTISEAFGCECNKYTVM